ncbi:MAG TPA: peptidoglycan DD-metalloendopeptidase family protein [Ignavibacteria bacterium]|nr:peptidoglycan DD-metalloendopeptidase family protein [Ignavibacteria bacterium]HMQ98999.1 peptidoglycan DD-metalloendopeptidase family protein [Ignavibacteria bacterium]
MGISFFLKYSLFLVLLLIITGATYEEILQDKKKQAENVEKYINENRTGISKITNRTAILNQQIDSVESAISGLNSFLKNYENESFMTPDQIAIETNMIIYLAEEVERIQNSFRQKVVSLYKHGENYELELLLSSKTPNEYLRRNQYLQKFSQNRKKELRELRAKKFILEEKKKMLTLSTSSQRFYIESKRNEKAVLDSRLKELRSLKSIAESESDLIAGKISRYETQLNNIRNFMNNLEANRESFAENKNNRLSYDSENLQQVRGNINLPVDIGLITTNFGNISDNKTLAVSLNNGVDFSIARGSKVYAIANGTVSILGEIPFYGKIVIITHANGFRSVYASLSETNVKAGDVIKLNQVIGKSGETLEGQTMHFELWQNSTPVNPREWLRF